MLCQHWYEGWIVLRFVLTDVKQEWDEHKEHVLIFNYSGSLGHYHEPQRQNGLRKHSLAILSCDCMEEFYDPENRVLSGQMMLEFFLWKPRPVTDPIPRAFGKQHLPNSEPHAPAHEPGLSVLALPLSRAACVCACGFVSALWGLGGKEARVRTKVATQWSEQWVGLCVVLRGVQSCGKVRMGVCRQGVTGNALFHPSWKSTASQRFLYLGQVVVVGGPAQGKTFLPLSWWDFLIVVTTKTMAWLLNVHFNAKVWNERR